MRFSKALCVLSVTVSLGACSNIKFNVGGKEYLEAKVKQEKVELYSKREIYDLDALSVSLVTTEHCQERVGDYSPSRNNLIDDLKEKTADMGGNGLVVEGCTETSYSQCSLYQECRGTAYVIYDPENRI